DTAHTRPDRAQIVLYNFSGVGPLALRTADGSATVVGDVQPRSSGAVSVNAVPVELALFRNGERLETLGDLGLARGQSFSVIVSAASANGEAVRVLIEQARLSLE
ncbi:MAG: hypothetical protein EA403_15590, partial [Spirochaetaceae bacterium]